MIPKKLNIKNQGLSGEDWSNLTIETDDFVLAGGVSLVIRGKHQTKSKSVVLNKGGMEELRNYLNEVLGRIS